MDRRFLRPNVECMTSEWISPTVLRGKHVRLEPLTTGHAEGLFAIGGDPGIWTWLSIRRPESVQAYRDYVAEHLAKPDVLAFAQVDAVTGAVAGTTSYYEISDAHRVVGIGHTWIGRDWQRTGLNTEAKLLLLEHAFETLRANRVAWHTDINNLRSQAAIERLGATKEGVLRRHRIRPDGTIRDTVSYSVIPEEWPAVRGRLRERLDRD
jgi:RimJ/RimL family protein N-acetyltransferase